MNEESIPLQAPGTSQGQAVPQPGSGQGIQGPDAAGQAPGDSAIAAPGAAPPAGDTLAGGPITAPGATDGVLQGPLAQIAEWAGLGGPVVWILAVMSILGLAVTIVKLAQFLRAGVWQRGRAAQAIAAFRSGDTARAAELLRGRKGLPDQVARAALRATAAHGPEPALREEIEQFASDRLEALRGNLRLLEAIAALAPLLGLFGTVLGMITAFQDMQGAGTRVSPDILAGGIWTALLTTAVGLAVAMPAVAIVTFLERAVDSLAHDLESFISQVFAGSAAAELEPANEGADGARTYAVARAG
ncbi:MAG: MotA/TolQ/ExbB proton channel family protein [Sneathiellaceae bacterium]